MQNAISVLYTVRGLDRLESEIVSSWWEDVERSYTMVGKLANVAAAE